MIRYLFSAVACWFIGSAAVAEDAPLRLRMENFTVTPSTGPVVGVQLENRSGKELEAAVKVNWPAGWKAAPAEQKVKVKPGESTTSAFTIEKAIDLAVNRYPVTVEARVGDRVVVCEQQVVCATAPYLKPQLDGRLDDWKDAVPIKLSDDGGATTVMTCWNRKQFCVAVRAEGMKAGALQFVLAPGTASDAGRFEFVVVAPEQDGPAKCYQLLQPGDDLAITGRERPLAGLESETLDARVTRDGDTTCFEVVAPAKAFPGLRPTPGREFRFSLLVHTPGALRDLGTAMNLPEDRRPPRAWCRWKGASFGAKPPFDGNVEFGFSSSIH
jgi:hypothetical protein